jgi:hypothetical protein
LEGPPEKNAGRLFYRLSDEAVNDVNYTNKPILFNEIFVHHVMNNAGRSEQSRFAHASLFTLFTVVHAPVNN